MLNVNMELVVGTYDEVILGFRVVEVGTELQIEASFTDHSHTGCVKCVAISGKGVLASGSTDETIRLLNIKKQRELGSLVHHDGTVTSLQFHKGFLFSTSEDKTLSLWKTFTWECLRTFKGHKAAVDCVSVHPSGKLALTVGRDRALHTWNLITGRSAYITNLKQVADIVRWSPEGDKYAIVVRNTVYIYSVETAETTLTLTTEAAVNSLEFLNNDICCYGGEGGNIVFHNITEDRQLHVCETGTNRIKGFCISSHKIQDDFKCKVLSTASSEGIIKLYKITEPKGEIRTELLLEHNTGFRITCLAVFNNTEVTDKPKQAVKEEHTVTEHNAEQSGGSDSEPSDPTDKADKLSKVNKKSKVKVETEKKINKNNESCKESVASAMKLSKTGEKSNGMKIETEKKFENKRNKRKMKEVCDGKDENIAKTEMSGTDRKQRKMNNQQGSAKSVDGTVSFVPTKEKKKFKKKKKKAKKTA